LIRKEEEMTNPKKEKEIGSPHQLNHDINDNKS